MPPPTPPHVDETTLRTRALVYARGARAQVEVFAAADNQLRTAFMHTTYRQQVGGHDHGVATTRFTYGGVWDFGSAHYLALVMLAQVAKVVERLDLDVPAYPGATPIRLLRNLEEHWDEVDGSALRALRQLDPDTVPGRVWFGGDRVAVGDATIDDLRAWLGAVEDAIRDAAESSGQWLPSDDDDEVGMTP